MASAGGIHDADFVIVGGGIAAVTCAETLADECPQARVILITASPLVKAVTNYQKDKGDTQSFSGIDSEKVAKASDILEFSFKKTWTADEPNVFLHGMVTVKMSRTLETFEVEERPTWAVECQCPNVTVLQTAVTALQAAHKTLTTSDGRTVRYSKLCICTGGTPKLIPGSNPYVVGIRDTGSVKDFQKKLSAARRIVVVGNGGIASELVVSLCSGSSVCAPPKPSNYDLEDSFCLRKTLCMVEVLNRMGVKDSHIVLTNVCEHAVGMPMYRYEVEKCEVIWAIKHQSISSAFVDEGAAQFFLPHLDQEKKTAPATVKRQKYAIEEGNPGEDGAGGDGRTLGSALGPDWATSCLLEGSVSGHGAVHVEYGVEVVRVVDPQQLTHNGLQPSTPSCFTDHPPPQSWPVYVELSNGQTYGCDLVVSATGVTPHTEPFVIGNSFEIAEDGGLKVNNKLETSVVDVYAAGDVCTASWQLADLWIQKRLWTQARQMGSYAARSMTAATNGEDITLDICFELFAHVTKLFGYKVVLIGLFNAQGLGSDYELLLRVTKGEEYVKVVLHNGRLVGAILIGETDMEETFENLALNQIDLTPLKDHLLDPAIDIDDFFD